MATITLRISDETNVALNALAEATERSKSYLALRAIDQYLELNSWQIDAIHEGIAEADAGNLLEHEDVKKCWEKRLANQVD